VIVSFLHFSVYLQSISCLSCCLHGYISPFMYHSCQSSSSLGNKSISRWAATASGVVNRFAGSRYISIFKKYALIAFCVLRFPAYVVFLYNQCCRWCKSVVHIGAQGHSAWSAELFLNVPQYLTDWRTITYPPVQRDHAHFIPVPSFSYPSSSHPQLSANTKRPKQRLGNIPFISRPLWLRVWESA
jgi:hypothetical protein